MAVLLRSIRCDAVEERRGFPFDVPAIRALSELRFDTPVTFFVGENGSGKSTLMEALAVLSQLPTVGSEQADRDATLTGPQELSRLLHPVWNRRTRRGFFLRAEDFFGFARRIAQLKAELAQDLGAREHDFADASDYTRSLAMGPARASLAALQRQYGDGVDARSHGESFIDLLSSRLVPGGLFLLDEPEAALSPQSQLALLTLIADAVEDGSQFIICTHSPILMAFPGATLYSFDALPVSRVSWDDVDHVTLTRAFLSDPDAFIRRLVQREDHVGD